MKSSKMGANELKTETEQMPHTVTGYYEAVITQN